LVAIGDVSLAIQQAAASGNDDSVAGTLDVISGGLEKLPFVPRLEFHTSSAASPSSMLSAAAEAMSARTIASSRPNGDPTEDDVIAWRKGSRASRLIRLASRFARSEEDGQALLRSIDAANRSLAEELARSKDGSEDLPLGGLILAAEHFKAIV